uniref:Phosphoglycerate mutase (2,3-diphosphoglycerate-dependent) n=1 Tax=Chromera velia CCMP2878 TaxID=1169474 RepID=A0A0G4HL94_9ALVE|eukprot:Cvel_7408.t1-p1 / transcript=Cvel_7408.t1 / gene=Cvel_7408 / organism=Chromera_velia_CCMP2878 / gene_product=Alpha-ribazole phosphatase, putative / transcript_product=Alpha-ribazole phosphatase, putative / location=Cvel_scaffold386:86415-87302(+) / protein_length=296 / sequence_SO=supercontig / SO=protein_coding / is_pseudo=false
MASRSCVFKLYLVRHGETDYNVEGRAQGPMPIPLNRNGLEQAHMLGQSLIERFPFGGPKPVHLVVFSSFLQAQQTGEAVFEAFKAEAQKAGKEPPEFLLMPEFGEMHYGDLIGQLLKDVGHVVRELKERQWVDGDTSNPERNCDAALPGKEGESFSSVIHRLRLGFLKIIQTFQDKGKLDNTSNPCEEIHVIVATHSQVIEAILVHLRAFSYLDAEERTKNKNCTMTTISCSLSPFQSNPEGHPEDQKAENGHAPPQKELPPLEIPEDPHSLSLSVEAFFEDLNPGVERLGAHTIW